MNNILLTGAYGLLGTEIRKYIKCLAPTIHELDVKVKENIYEYCIRNNPTLIVHAAAYTDVKKAQDNRDECWQVNAIGTKYIVEVAQTLNIPVLYISTDYVFDGEVGMYREHDTPFPVNGNFYAFSKFCGELIVGQYEKGKIIRTSFKPIKWEYEYAFDDVYTSADYVDIIAKDIAHAIINFNNMPTIIHIATERKSIYQLAKKRNPKVKPNKRLDVGSWIPKDVSLNTDSWKKLKGSK